MLAKNQILPDSAGNEGVNAVNADQGKNNTRNDFCRNILKEASNMQSDVQ